MCEEQNSPAEGTCRPANASLLCLPVDECFLFSDGLYFVATLTLAECHRASSVQYWLCTCWPCSSSSSSGTHTGSIHPLLVLWIYRVCVCVCVCKKNIVNVLRKDRAKRHIRSNLGQGYSLGHVVNENRACVRASDHIACQFKCVHVTQSQSIENPPLLNRVIREVVKYLTFDTGNTIGGKVTLLHLFNTTQKV